MGIEGYRFRAPVKFEAATQQQPFGGRDQLPGFWNDDPYHGMAMDIRLFHANRYRRVGFVGNE